STTVAATLTVLIGMFVLGVSIALGTWVLSWSDHVKNQLEVKAYLTLNVTPQQINNVRTLIVKEQETGKVRTFGFCSASCALRVMKHKYPDLVKGISYNPLPASFDVTPTKAEFNAGIANDILHA